MRRWVLLRGLHSDGWAPLMEPCSDGWAPPRGRRKAPLREPHLDAWALTTAPWWVLPVLPGCIGDT